jgi:hypothetical protein
MSYLPSGASDLERIADVWCYLTGKGVELSPLDAEAAARWLELAPWEVVARALQEGVKRLAWDAPQGRAPARSLRACEPDVRKAIEAYRARAIGGRGHG